MRLRFGIRNTLSRSERRLSVEKPIRSDAVVRDSRLSLRERCVFGSESGTLFRGAKDASSVRNPEHSFAERKATITINVTPPRSCLASWQSPRVTVRSLRTECSTANATVDPCSTNGCASRAILRPGAFASLRVVASSMPHRHHSIANEGPIRSR